MRPRPIGSRTAGVAAVPAKYERGGRGSSGAGGRASSRGRRSGASASTTRGELEPPPGRCWNSWSAGRRPPGERPQVSSPARRGRDAVIGLCGPRRRLGAEGPTDPGPLLCAVRSVREVVTISRKGLATLIEPSLKLLLQPRPFFSCALALSSFFQGPLR